MASVLNKRQQARNERTLQDLIKNVPGNSVCADCGARNPGEHCNPRLHAQSTDDAQDGPAGAYVIPCPPAQLSGQPSSTELAAAASSIGL